MKQFCDSIDDCSFGVDLICVYCDRKMPKKKTKEKDYRDYRDYREIENVRETGISYLEIDD